MLASLFRSLRRMHRPAGLGLAALVITAVIGGVYYYEVGSTRGYTPLMFGEFAFRNLLIRHGRKSVARPDIVFLGYDEDSLSLNSLWPEELESSPALKLIAQTQGSWPWPRAVQAMILERLAQAGAKAVVFDFVFLGPSADDDVFRTMLDRYADRVVLGANYDFNKQTLTLPSATLFPSNNAQDSRIGYVEYYPDRDERIHALTFRLTPGNIERDPNTPIYESLIARTLRKAGRSDLIPRDSLDKFYGFRYGAAFKARPIYEIFVDSLWKANYGSGSFFKDKMVVVGPVASILHDAHDTPLGLIPGPAIHVQALTAALNQDFLHPTTRAQDLCLIATAGLLAWLLGLGLRQPLGRVGALILAGAGYVCLVYWLYNRFGLQLAAFTPLLNLYFCGFGGTVGEYVIERAEKARVRGVLDRLVSKDIVRELLEDRETYAALVRGQRRPATILFSDVRGFTTLSEAAGDPAAFIAQLNEYLGEMVDVVFKHRGTLDKFIGDAVMAVWGTMHTEGAKDDACAAVAAGLEMRQRLAALNAKWAAEGKLRIEIGIGLNHGEPIVGALGSERSKMEITVMGDAVNLASRMEGLTKDYGLDMLIGESVARMVSAEYQLRTVDLVRVKGKKKPTEIMAVVGLRAQTLPESQQLLLAAYEDAILLYRKQEFAAAARVLEDCLKIDPSDYLANLYLDRCQVLVLEGPIADWDGVRIMTTK